MKRTFRAPFVNWIFRTATANEPAFVRYLWGQVKPVFGTRAFAELTVEYREAVLSGLESEGPLPTFRRPDTGLAPAEYRELRGQLATFDVVAPRLAVLFETADRALNGEGVGSDPREDRAATAPFPEHLDRDRGLAPTMADSTPGELGETVEGIRAFHGFEGDLPSVYRSLAQWPGYLEPAWTALEPRFESEAFEDAREETAALVSAYVDGVPYRPRLAPDDLRTAGFSGSVIDSMGELFGAFNTGPVETVLPALPVWAASVGSEGERSL